MQVRDPDEDWEARCLQCGRCCYEKIEFEGEVYYTDEPCQFLDPETRLCRVYGRRQQERPDCLPITRVLVAKGWLPSGCGYVSDLPGYTGPNLWDEEEGDG